MNIGPIVEVAIGIVFLWITISLATIQIQEWIGQIANKRAKDLEDTIRMMLADKDLKEKFYSHPIIRGLTANKEKPPSYIPSQQFALTLFDMAMNADTESSVIQRGLDTIRNELEQATQTSRNQAVIDALNNLSGLARRAAATDLGKGVTNASYEILIKKMEEFSKKHKELKPAIQAIASEANKRKAEIDALLNNNLGGKDADPAVVQLRRGIAALSGVSPDLNKTLQALLLNVEEYVTQGESQLGLARKNVEKWFNDSMDRLNGVFKRYAQFWAFVIGLYLALALNIDSINLALYLWREPTVRQVLVANASQFELREEDLATSPERAMQEIRKQFVGLNLPIGWVINEPIVTDENKSEAEAYRPYWDGQCQLFPDADESFGIPIIGFEKCIAPPQSNNQTNIALKLFGILFTAGAAAQGAPFWFDLLKKLINLRGTGVNPIEKEAAK
jgi:hypothetical protein